MMLSVIIPVYNAASSLRHCLESIFCLDVNFEVICVDDGSNDDSRRILFDISQKCNSVRILTQSHKGAGAARNIGLAAAQGDWLWFVDADDRICGEAVLPVLREAANSGTPPDILLFNADEVDAKTGLRTPVPLQVELAATRTDIHWLAACGTAPWNKVFRRDFVLRYNLQFQEIPRANDAAFVVSALCLARSICVIPSVGYLYLINAGGSLQQTNTLSPLCFYDALTEIALRLKQQDIFGMYDPAVKFLALRMIVGNLFSLRSRDAFKQVCAFLRTRGDEFGIFKDSTFPASSFLLKTYRKVLDGKLPNYSLGRIIFSIYNRGFISFIKHAIGRLMR